MDTSVIAVDRFCTICCYEWKQSMTRLELWELVNQKNFKDCPRCSGIGDRVTVDNFKQIMNDENN